jgi:hypothetical protein
MISMANEARRVAGSGWLQTPAWEFPVEPHFRLPFMHWFATPAQAKLLYFSRPYRKESRSSRRVHAERITLMSKAEVRLLFADCDITVERFALLPKSYVAQW